MSANEVLFTVNLCISDEHYVIDYHTLNSCMSDRALATLLDSGGRCEIWIGELKITGRPIDSSDKLREALISNSQVILRGAERKG